MSDEFDREAERERLREKYERDKQKREASERMSELLLQGATMTNNHCPECQSPVFRYDGSEFCPTCEREVTRDGATEESLGASENGEVADGEAETPVETEPESVATAEAPEPETRSEESKGPDTETERSGTATETTPEQTVPAPTPDRHRRQRRADGDVDDVEASLIRTLEDLTARAEETADVGRKRQLLAAAREAAETLDALRRV